METIALPINEAKSQSQLLTERQTADMLGLTCRTLQKWRLLGKGMKFIRVSSRCIRYRLSDIETWIDEKTKTSTSTA